jgi:hypothetical protein
VQIESIFETVTACDSGSVADSDLNLVGSGPFWSALDPDPDPSPNMTQYKLVGVCNRHKYFRNLSCFGS